MANYASDEDLQVYRPDILALGVSNWDEQHALATSRINDYLDKWWYRSAARQRSFDWRDDGYAFDPTKVAADTALIYAAVALTLMLAYGYLAKNLAEDGFTAQRDYWQKEYERTMKEVVTAGVDYTWPDSGELEQDTPRGVRRLQRA